MANEDEICEEVSSLPLIGLMLLGVRKNICFSVKFFIQALHFETSLPIHPVLCEMIKSAVSVCVHIEVMVLR